MSVHQFFAQISEGEVKSVIVCENYDLANYLARATFGNAAFSVECSQYACQGGDTYHDGFFYRKIDGTETEIKYVPTQEQQVATLEQQKTEIQIALAEQYETNLSLQEEVTSTQIAIADLYEGKAV